MNLKTRIKELAAKAEAVTEFARGDYAIPALKKILVGSQGMPVGEFNKVSPIFKGKFPKAAYRAELFPSKTASSATRSEILEAIAPIRKEAADQIRGVRRAQQADELADVPFFSRHPGMKISDAIQRRY